MCDEIEDTVRDVSYATPESAAINPNDVIDYWLIFVVLLATACWLLLVVMVVKYYIKCELTILCLLSLP